MASLATVNYNYEKPDMLPFRFFRIRQMAKPCMLLKRCMLEPILSIPPFPCIPAPLFCCVTTEKQTRYICYRNLICVKDENAREGLTLIYELNRKL